MMLRSGFFNSVNGDRTYNASRFAEYFASFIGNGIFPNPSTNLQVMANNDMTVTVKAGKAWVNGYILINDGDYILSIAPADGVLNRIDRVVARFDVIGREITVEVKQGAFGSIPVAPALQRDADAFELGLADIYIGNGVVAINQGNITDLRLDSELCGIVHGVVEQVDTTTLFNQYTDGFELKKDEFEQEFMLWFQTLQDVLDENTASNLLNMINANTNSIDVVDQKVDAHLAESATQAHLAKNIGLEDTAGNFVATEVEGAMQELFTNVSNGKSLVGGAITDVDDSVVIPTDPTFNDLASAIGQISTGKKWASGIVTGSRPTMDVYTTGGSYITQWEVKVVGLGFKPSNIVFWLNNPTNNRLMYFDINAKDNSKLACNVNNSFYEVIESESLSGNYAAISSDGFRMPIHSNFSAVGWKAYE